MTEVRTNKPVDSVPYGTTVIPENRLTFLAGKCRETLERIPGNVLEVGVYRGGTIIALGKQVLAICPENKVIGVDTFSGHPYTDGHPVHPTGKYNDVDIAELRNSFVENDVDSIIELHVGKIEDIFAELNLSNISFAHIDCDLYTPVKFCAEHITPLIKKGGVIYFDDYGHEHCPGATKAVEEVFNKDQIKEVSLPDGTCWSAYIEL